MPYSLSIVRPAPVPFRLPNGQRGTARMMIAVSLCRRIEASADRDRGFRRMRSGSTGSRTIQRDLRRCDARAIWRDADGGEGEIPTMKYRLCLPCVRVASLAFTGVGSKPSSRGLKKVFSQSPYGKNSNDTRRGERCRIATWAVRPAVGVSRKATRSSVIKRGAACQISAARLRSKNMPADQRQK